MDVINMSRKYLIISPCRNEEQYMRKTLDAVCQQTVLPEKWIIVDDGSTDNTPSILEDYAKRYSFITIVRRKNRGHRKVGPGVIEAFYDGMKTDNIDDYSYICKLDLDLDLPPRYFEILIERMEGNHRIGTCSGKPYFIDEKSGDLISEACGDENSVGMTKFYRVECFKQIGGFVKQVMWDGIDGHRCRMLGWIAISWDEPDIRFTHLRPMGSSQVSIFTGRTRHGFGQYFMGTSFIYMTASAIYRIFRPPYLVGGLAMWWGYVRSALLGKKRLEGDKFRIFLRKYQWSCILKGKSRATEELNKQQESMWNPDAPGFPFPEL